VIDPSFVFNAFNPVCEVPDRVVDILEFFGYITQFIESINELVGVDALWSDCLRYYLLHVLSGELEVTDAAATVRAALIFVAGVAIVDVVERAHRLEFPEPFSAMYHDAMRSGV